MPAIYAYAPAKTILVGEHAVVYGVPAIAMPVFDLRSKATVQALPMARPGSVQISAADIALNSTLEELPVDHPISVALQQVLTQLGISRAPACKISLTSPIPIGSGLGSSASIAVALIRAFSSFLGGSLKPEEISKLAYEVEKVTHGHPSGIDNAVIAYEQPIYFVKGKDVQLIDASKKLFFLIADSGETRQTAEAVSLVRQAWENRSEETEAKFTQIKEIVEWTLQAIIKGDLWTIGHLMNANHYLLTNLGLSTPKLDSLILTARQAGAFGAKLTGAGLGGNIVALVNEEISDSVESELRHAGAVGVYHTSIGGDRHA